MNILEDMMKDIFVEKSSCVEDTDLKRSHLIPIFWALFFLPCLMQVIKKTL